MRHVRKIKGLCGLGLLLATTVAADVIDPHELGCRGRKLGAACKVYGGSGTCVEGNCGRHDYSTRRMRSFSVPCLVCKVAPATIAPAGAVSPVMGILRRRWP